MGQATGDDTLSKHSGMAPEAKLAVFDIKNGDESLNPGSAFALTDSIFSTAYIVGARVFSNSWGCKGTAEHCNQYSEYARATDEFLHEHDDMLIVFSAGNDGNIATDRKTSSVGSPGTAKNVVTVGASMSALESFEESLSYNAWARAESEVAESEGKPDGWSCCSATGALRNYCCEESAREYVAARTSNHNIEQAAEFSSRGPTYDGRIKPDIMSVGQNVISASSDGDPESRQCNPGTPSEFPDAPTLETRAGTSMAAPVVAGGAALVREYLLEGYYPSGRPNVTHSMAPKAALLKAMLLNGAVEMTGEIDLETDYYNPLRQFVPLGSIYPPREFQGFGRAQLAATDRGYGVLHFGDDPPTDRQLWLSQDRKVATNERHTVCLRPRVDGVLKATLVWTDPPATAAAARALVNDLDLLVGTSSTNVLAGNYIEYRDDRNTVEHVLFPVTAGVPVLVQVAGFHVPSGDNLGQQTYALVMQGPFDRELVEEDCRVFTTMVEGDLSFFNLELDHFAPVPDSLIFKSYQKYSTAFIVALAVGAIAGIGLTVAVCCAGSAMLRYTAYHGPEPGKSLHARDIPRQDLSRVCVSPCPIIVPPIAVTAGTFLFYLCHPCNQREKRRREKQEKRVEAKSRAQSR